MIRELTALSAEQVKEGNNIDNSKYFMLVFFLGVVTMLFAGFTSAYIIRSSATDWYPVAMPNMIWSGCILLVLSSFCYEAAKYFHRGLQYARSRVFLTLTFICGILFIFGQISVYQQLVDMGIYVATNPHGSFFYILSGIHILHFLCGIIWLLVIIIYYAYRRFSQLTHALQYNSIYWHYFTVVWLYLVFLLFIFRRL